MVKGFCHKTKFNGNLEIVEYVANEEVKVKFTKTGFLTESSAGNIRKGLVKDNLNPSVFDVGFVGFGTYKTRGLKSKLTKEYECWSNMMARCYSAEFAKKYPTYADCTVHPDWHNFQAFAKWYEENYPNNGGKYHLDKDLLVVGNKIYSPDMCIFTPCWLNVLTVNRISKRGCWPIGVTIDKRAGKFASRCKNGKGDNVRLGYFQTPEEAHLAWRKYKLALALDKKPAMDAIDLRIYPNVVQIIMEAR